MSDRRTRKQRQRGGVHGSVKSHKRSIAKKLSTLMTHSLKPLASHAKREGNKSFRLSKGDKQFVSKLFKKGTQKMNVIRENPNSKSSFKSMHMAVERPQRAARSHMNAQRAEKMAQEILLRAKKDAAKAHKQAVDDLTALMQGL